jgi:hypothetical protein
MMIEYEQGLNNEEANFVTVEGKTEAELAVPELMRRHKIEGSVEKWVKGYNEEMERMMTRLDEVFGEERERVLNEEKVIRLRMNPEPKKLSVEERAAGAEEGRA